MNKKEKGPTESQDGSNKKSEKEKKGKVELQENTMDFSMEKEKNAKTLIYKHHSGQSRTNLSKNQQNREREILNLLYNNSMNVDYSIKGYFPLYEDLYNILEISQRFLKKEQINSNTNKLSLKKQGPNREDFKREEPKEDEKKSEQEENYKDNLDGKDQIKDSEGKNQKNKKKKEKRQKEIPENEEEDNTEKNTPRLNEEKTKGRERSQIEKKRKWDENFDDLSQWYKPKIILFSSRGHEIQRFLRSYSAINGIESYTLNFTNFFSRIFQNLEYLERKISKIFLQKNNKIKNKVQKENTQYDKEYQKDLFLLYIPLIEYSNIIDQIPNQVLENGQFFSKHFFISSLLEKISKIDIQKLNLIIILQDLKQNKQDYEMVESEYVKLDIQDPNQKIRSEFLEFCFEQYSKKNLYQQVDFEQISLNIEDCGLADIRGFVKKVILNKNLEQFKNPTEELNLDTSFLQNLIEKQDFQWRKASRNSKKESRSKTERSFGIIKDEKTIDSLDGGNIFPSTVKEFENQMYLDAASKDYQNISIALDKLKKGHILHEIDRKTLADYPFLLKVDPELALKKLNDAKVRIEKILHINIVTDIK